MKFTKETEDRLNQMVLENKAEKFHITAFKEQLMMMVNNEIETFVSRQHKVTAEQFIAIQTSILKGLDLDLVEKRSGEMLSQDEILNMRKISDTHDSNEKLTDEIREAVIPTKVQKKTLIFDNLEARFGRGRFNYTAMTIAALMVNKFINKPSDYDKDYRGYYACAFTAYGGNDYMFRPGKDGRYLLKIDRGIYEIHGTKNI